MKSMKIFWQLAVFLAPLTSFGQPSGLPRDPSVGKSQLGAYSLSEIESIDLANGNVSLKIPLAALPTDKGGHEGFQVLLRYDSKLWSTKKDAQGTESLVGNKGANWRYGIHYELEADFDPATTLDCSVPNKAYVHQLRLILPDGSKRAMALKGQFDGGVGYYPIRMDGENYWAKNCNPSTPSTHWEAGPLLFYSMDGTYLRLEIDVDGDANPLNNAFRLYLPNGTVVFGTTGPKTPQAIIHSDGTNQYIYNGTNPEDNLEETVLLDSAERFIYCKYKTDSSVDAIMAVGTNGQTYGWLVMWDISPHFTPQYTATPGTDITSSIPMRISSILLPSGQGYAFDYQAKWGELSHVLLPSLNASSVTAQASVVYTYNRDSQTTTPKACEVLSNSILSKTVFVTTPYDQNAVSLPSEPWSFSFTSDQSTMTAPDGGITTTKFFGYDTCYTTFGNWRAGVPYRITRPDGSILERVWQNNPPFDTSTNASTRFANNFVQYELTTFTNGGAPQATDPVSGKQMIYDKNGNVISTIEYDWGTYGQITRDGSGVATGYGNSSIKRKSDQTYTVQVPLWNSFTDNSGLYNSSTSPGSQPRNQVLRQTVERASVIESQVEYEYHPQTFKVTKEKRWDSSRGSLPMSAGNTLSTVFTYGTTNDDKMLLMNVTDPRGVVRKFGYTAVCGSYLLYPTSIIEAFGTASAHETQKQYECNTGAVKLITDVQNNVSTKITSDVYGRPTEQREAFGIASHERVTQTQYDDVAGRIVVKKDQNTNGDGRLVTISHYDALGRIRLRRTLENGANTAEIDSETAGIKTQYRYGYNYDLVSNPYRAATSTNAASSEAETMGWTKTERDQGARVSIARSLAADGVTSMGSTTYSYDRQFTTVTDADSKVKRTKIDSLGRLDEVVEAPSLATKITTTYQYNGLDNLISVNRSNTQEAVSETRTFEYDSLGRLKRAGNPETGSICYGLLSGSTCEAKYDENGNLLNKTDARGVVTTMTYDGRNRLRTKSYSSCPSGAYCSPTATFNYDVAGVSYGWGRLGSVDNTVSKSEYLAYDPHGRVAASKQTTGSQQYSFGTNLSSPGYTYNLADQLRTMKFPSGRILTYTYDAVNRPDTIIGTVGSTNATYLSAATYTPSGQQKLRNYGNGTQETYGYNQRLQATEIKVMLGVNNLLTLGYGYGSSNNNGNVTSHTISPLGITQSFQYDDFNRLASAVEGSTWSETYGYDQFGNRWRSASSGLPTTGVRPNGISWFRDSNGQVTKNRLKDGPDVSYDASGNLLKIAPFTMIYDGENRIASAAAPDTLSYIYDGEGKRVKSVVGTKETFFVYDAFGQLAAEYSTLPSLQVGRQYLYTDALGSTRMVTDGVGGQVQRLDYLPYGETLWTSNRTTALGYGGSTVKQRFTGKERDEETNLDYFGARYYSGIQGRWASPDLINVTRARLLNPSNTLNKYIYAANNPLKYVDPDGQDITIFYRRGNMLNPADSGHAFAAVLNQDTGKVAFMSFAPKSGAAPYGQGAYNAHLDPDYLRQHASLTIRTTPEQAQKAIDEINRRLKNPGTYWFLGNNCTTQCESLLRLLDIATVDGFHPDELWTQLYRNYSAQAKEHGQFGVPVVQYKPGQEFGQPRFSGPGFDYTKFLWQLYTNQDQIGARTGCVMVQGPNGIERDCQ